LGVSLSVKIQFIEIDLKVVADGNEGGWLSDEDLFESGATYLGLTNCNGCTGGQMLFGDLDAFLSLYMAR
jgi:hypothetical protein